MKDPTRKLPQPGGARKSTASLLAVPPCSASCSGWIMIKVEPIPKVPEMEGGHQVGACRPPDLWVLETAAAEKRADPTPGDSGLDEVTIGEKATAMRDVESCGLVSLEVVMLANQTRFAKFDYSQVRFALGGAGVPSESIHFFFLTS